jgi:hypothetical protein
LSAYTKPPVAATSAHYHSAQKTEFLPRLLQILRHRIIRTDCQSTPAKIAAMTGHLSFVRGEVSVTFENRSSAFLHLICHSSSWSLERETD